MTRWTNNSQRLGWAKDLSQLFRVLSSPFTDCDKEPNFSIRDTHSSARQTSNTKKSPFNIVVNCSGTHAQLLGYLWNSQKPFKTFHIELHLLLHSIAHLCTKINYGFYLAKGGAFIYIGETRKTSKMHSPPF